MPAERNAFKLGLAMLVFAALFIAILVFLAPTGAGDLRFEVRYPHDRMPTQIKPGAAVLCAGQPVGSVQKLELKELPVFPDEPENRRLYLVVSVAVDNSRIDLRETCVIRPEQLILGGGGKLVIVDRGQGEPVERGDRIDGATGADIAGLTQTLQEQLDPDDPQSLLAMIRSMLDASDPDSVVGKVHGSLDDINAITAQLRQEFDPKEQQVLLAKLHAILTNFNQATGLIRDELDQEIDHALLAKIHKTLDTLDQGLNSAVGLLEDNRSDIHEAVVHVRETSRILEEQIARRIAEQLDTEKEASLLAKVHVAIDKLGTSLDDINTLTEKTSETVVLNAERIDRMIANFQETSEHLRAASEEIRISPWRLFYRPKTEEVAEASLFGAARSFSQAASRLDDAVARLQSMAEAGIEPDGGDQAGLDQIRERLQQTFNEFRKAETALWKQLNIQ